MFKYIQLHLKHLGFLPIPNIRKTVQISPTPSNSIGGELAGGRSLAVGWLLALMTEERWHATGDTWHVICDTLHMTHKKTILKKSSSLSVRFCPFWYWCYYSNTSRCSVSPVCKICSSSFYWALTIRSNKLLFSTRYSRWLWMFCIKLR